MDTSTVFATDWQLGKLAVACLHQLSVPQTLTSFSFRREAAPPWPLPPSAGCGKEHGTAPWPGESAHGQTRIWLESGEAGPALQSV